MVFLRQGLLLNLELTNFSWANWPASPQGSPVSAALALGLQAQGNENAFYLGAGGLNSGAHA